MPNSIAVRVRARAPFAEAVCSSGQAAFRCLPAGQTGTPMTYMLNGKQYIVVAIGSQNYGAELLAFRLPD